MRPTRGRPQSATTRDAAEGHPRTRPVATVRHHPTADQATSGGADREVYPGLDRNDATPELGGGVVADPGIIRGVPQRGLGADPEVDRDRARDVRVVEHLVVLRPDEFLHGDPRRTGIGATEGTARIQGLIHQHRADSLRAGSSCTSKNSSYPPNLWITREEFSTWVGRMVVFRHGAGCGPPSPQLIERLPACAGKGRPTPVSLGPFPACAGKRSPGSSSPSLVDRFAARAGKRTPDTGQQGPLSATCRETDPQSRARRLSLDS